MSGAPSPLERSAHRLYVHVAWTTLGQLPLIGRTSRAATEGHVIRQCRRTGLVPIAVAATADRIHALVRFPPDESVAALVHRLKAETSASLRAGGHGARWAGGYAAASVGAGELRDVRRRLARLGEDELVGTVPR
ncbi:MAG: transposase [Gemmatimonadota bacterium]